MYLRLTTVAAFVAVILTVAPAAFAQESGSFRALHSYQHTYITVDHGDRTFTGGIAERYANDHREQRRSVCRRSAQRFGVPGVFA